MVYVRKSQRGKLSGQERTDWAKIAREYTYYPGTMGKFHRHLCEAILLADKGNKARLRKAYPELIKELQSLQ